MVAASLVVLAAILLILGTVDANGQDVTAPELDRAIVDGANLVVFYDEMLDENSVPTVAAKMDTLVDGSRETSRTSALAAGTYRIVVTSGEQEKESLVTSVAISGNEVRLTLAPPVACGASVVVSYSIPPLNPIRDTAGNEAVAFNDHEVTNSTQCPVSGTELGLALGSVAAVVLGTSILNQSDAEVPALAYTGTLAEAAANDGSVTGSIAATLTGSTFTPTVVSAPHVTVSNVPAGLTASLVRTSATVVTLTLTGTSNAHANANDVSNLTITFSDDAFTIGSASAVSGSTRNDLTINFRDASAIMWAGSLTEVAANDGSVTGSITATLAGDTYTSMVVSAPHVTVANVPAGLTASLVRTSATVVTLTLTGTANAHTNDVSNISVTFSDGAFTNEGASTVTGSSKSDIGIDFRDASTITWAGTLTEAAANDGSVTGSITATLVGDTFTPAVIFAPHVSVSNVPAGLTASLVRTSATVVTLTLTGTANAHANANDVSNLTVTFSDGAFTNEDASTVTGSSKADIGIDFRDASTITWAGTLTEAAANDGSVTGSITATLAGDTYTSTVVSAPHVTVSNVPAGLTASLVRTSATVITLTLTGTANAHANANDVSNLTITFANGAFTNEEASTVAGASKSDVRINFKDASTITWAGTLTEAAANDGSVTGSITATLAGDTYTSTVVSAPHVSVTNVPAGLTASLVRTSATVITLTLTGTATAHANANDVSNLTITFSDGAFTNEDASTVTGSSKADIGIDFRDASIITWAGTLTEAAANDGSVTGSITATLTGNTFTSTVVSAPHVSVTNVPAGLTASLVRTSATVVTLTLTGTANAHANANDVSNLTVTFSDGAFTTGPASAVSGSTRNDLTVNFKDASIITWAGTLTEAAANNGSVTGSITATLTGNTFTPAVISAPHVSVSNVPAGLTASLVRTSATVVTLTLTGTANAHANDVSNLTVTFSDGAFTNEDASTVTGSSKSDIGIDFRDASTITWAGTLTEAAANDGAVTGTITAMLAGDTFTPMVVSAPHVTVSNVPAGLTASLVRTSATIVTLTLTGTATAHANDVSNLNITFNDGAFTNEDASTVTGSSKSDIAIDFRDVSTIIWSGMLTEAANGSVTGSITATLTGDTFTPTVVSASHVTVSNVPAGLTASLVRTSATVITLTLTGTANAHANANDVSNLTVTFSDGAFTNEGASTVTGSRKTDIGINFRDATITFAGTLTEAAANDGSVTGSITATLTDDTFTPAVVSAPHVSVTNIPAGLTASLVRTSATVVTLTLTGTADAHVNADDVNNLTITFSDGAFTTGPASAVSGSTKNDLTIDFRNAYAITWAGTLTEAAANDGSVTGSITATLTGDTYTSTVVSAPHVTVANVPAGLTASLVRTSATVITLTLIGAATAHANANDVSNLTVTFANGAFTTGPASAVSGSTRNDLTIDFRNASAITWAGTLTEAAANDGSVTGSITATLSGDTYTSTVVSAPHVTVSNVPAGLTASLVRTSATVITLTLTGTANAHANANDVSNLTVTFANGAFTTGPASAVSGSTRNDLTIDFRNASAITWAGTLTEAAANDGSVTGSITATLSGDTYTSTVVSAPHVTVSNVPAGLTASLVRTSATVITLTLTGTANAHANANDVSNLTVTFANGAFTTGPASAVFGSTKNDLTINFRDASTITWAGTLTEAAANDGSVTGSITATLSGDTYTSTVVSAPHVTVSNVPAGLTASLVRTSATVITLTLTGTANAHANANDVSNLTVTFANGAFTTGPASAVFGSTKNNLTINFRDASTITWAGTLTEAAANDGSVTGSITATLSGDTYTSTVVSAPHVTVSNVPAGLTASLVRTSATVITLTLTGTANAHANANDVSNLIVTFANGAFTTVPASAVSGSTKNDLTIDFRNASAITWAGTLTEAAANDGSVTGSITATLSGDTYTSTVVSAPHVTVSNVPAGLTASLVRTSATVITLTLTGTANAHANANDVSNLTVTFNDGAFTNEGASTVTGSSKADIGIDFTDASTITWAGTLTEAAANDGSVTGSITATLTGDTYTSTVVSAPHVTVSNVPAGLTASLVRTSATVITLTLTGTANAHANANDVSNLTVTFANGAFTTGPASAVSGSTRVATVTSGMPPPSLGRER